MSDLHDRLEQAELTMRRLGAISPPPAVADTVLNRAFQFGGCSSQMDPALLAVAEGLYLAAQAIAIGNRDWLATINITPESLHPTGTPFAIGIRFYSSGSLSNVESLEAVKGGFVRHGLSEAWHENGVKSSQTNWQHGQRHGKAQVWDASGVIREEVTYKNGLVVGKRITYFEDGRVALVENRDDKSVAHGVQLFFRSEDGFLQSANVYDHGEIIEQIVYEEPGLEIAGTEFGHPHNGVAYFWNRPGEPGGSNEVDN